MATILEQFCWPKLTKNCLAHPTYRWVVHYCYFEFLNQIWKWLKTRCRKFIVVTIKVEAYSYWLMTLFLCGTDYCGCQGRNDLWWLWDDTCGDYGMHSNIAGWQRSGQRGFKQWGLGEGTFLWRRKGDGKGGAGKKDRGAQKKGKGLKKGKVIPNPVPHQVVSLRIRLAGTKSYLTVYFKRQESCEAPCWNFDDLSNSVGKFSHS